uniref:Lasiocepsin n=1 Tax=Lasioglossum laticeps TaxID=88510 RepID=W5IDB3_LASLA|nr:Chain A, lasiocepsin [Lasioglossum laticeps]
GLPRKILCAIAKKKGKCKGPLKLVCKC